MTILLLFLLLGPAHAQEYHPWEDMTGSEVCELIKRELMVAVDYGTITEFEAERVVKNCFRNFGNY